MKTHTKTIARFGFATVLITSVAVSTPAQAFGWWSWIFGASHDSRVELDVTVVEPEPNDVAVRKNTQMSRGNVTRTVIISGKSHGNAARATAIGNHSAR